MDVSLLLPSADAGAPCALPQIQLRSCSVIYICRCCLQKLESLDVVGEAFARLDAAIAEERFEGAPALQSRLSGGSCQTTVHENV